MLLKITVIVCLSLLALYLCLRILTKKLLSNHIFFALICRKFYNYYYSIIQLEHLRTNNFGYSPVDEEIIKYGPDLQYGIQLYKELVKNHSGYLINEKNSLVEIGCGKGAGAEYLIKKFMPQKYTGVDFSEKAIDFCTNYYKQVKNVHFVCADAHQLPLVENSADVVLNVESSHLYKNQEKFFNEVYRILKPSGKFLFTDYRCVKNCPIDDLEKYITGSGFSITEKRIITPQIQNACMLASERRQKLVEARPWYLRKYFRHYAILNGSKKSRMLANGEIIYFIYHLEKNNGTCKP